MQHSSSSLVSNVAEGHVLYSHQQRGKQLRREDAQLPMGLVFLRDQFEEVDVRRVELQVATQLDPAHVARVVPWHIVLYIMCNDRFVDLRDVRKRKNLIR